MKKEIHETGHFYSMSISLTRSVRTGWNGIPAFIGYTEKSNFVKEIQFLKYRKRNQPPFCRGFEQIFGRGSPLPNLKS